MGDNLFTIILLRLNDLDSFKRYQFVFPDTQMGGELEIIYWNRGAKSGEGGMGETLREINDRVKERSEWKLIIYDEWQKAMEEGEEKINTWKMDSEIELFMSILSGKATSPDSGDKLEGAFPVQLLYVRSVDKKYIPLADSSSLCRIDGEEKFGGNIRMLQMGMESENGRQKSLSEFALCCVLLSLAIGQIPYTFMEAGYLYDLDIEMDQEKFGQYVAMLDERLKQIEACSERERENLKQRMRNVVPFPPVTFQRILLEDEEPEEDVPQRVRILTFKEMLACDDIEDVLKRNKEILTEKMFYPKGLLHEESRRIRRIAESMKGTENFLDEVAQEMLQKQISDTINEMCAQKDAQLEQQKFEDEIYKAEKTIRDQAGRLLERRKRWWVLLTFGFLELFVTEPYIIQYILTEKRYDLWPYCVLAAFLTFVLVILGYFFYLLVLHKKSWGAYEKKVCGQLSEYRRNKKLYLENILLQTLKYQYYEKIKREQKQLLSKWNQDREMLACHVRMLENGKLGLEPLLHLAGKEKQWKYQGDNSVKIDFTKEPREEEYYRLPLPQESRLEINHSGYMTKAGYPFICRLILKKSIRNN